MTTQELTTSQVAAWTSYQRMRVQLAGRISHELARTTGLSEADYEILTALTDAPDDSVRALALRCGLEWEKSRLSHQLRRMEQRGLVTREDCAEDNRGAVVRVTEAGRKIAAEARQHYEATVRRYVTDVLSDAQLAELEDIAATVLRQFERVHGA